jgi:aldehyde:ferredoxin oxidoreductase
MTDKEHILKIDLGSKRASRHPIPAEVLARFLGGRGLAAALSYDGIPADCTPSAPGNVLTICTGLLTGSAAPSAARTHLCALSPLTGILGSSNAGGFFGADLRSCGVAGLVITGRSDRPVYLYIDENTVEIRDAAPFWGLETGQSESRLRAAIGDPKLRIMGIGPAGENGSAMACIILDTHNAAGRTGLGAVMGAKRLKAIAVRGGRSTVPASRTQKAAIREFIRDIQNTEMFRKVSRHGQSGYIGWCNEMGMLATRNYATGVFDRAASICGSAMDGRVVKRRSCHRCPIHCKADVRIPGGAHAGETGPRPEFESITALGSKCGQGDMDAVLHLSNLCGQYGLDTISAGAAIAFAMDLFERGIIDSSVTGGIPLVWGDAGAQARLLEQMAFRRDFGAVLTDGVRAAAAAIGRGSERFAHHAKGLELCAYDPRGAMGTALGYAVSERGGDYASVFASAEYRWNAAAARERLGHVAGADRLSPLGKPRMVRRTSICAAAVDAIGICKVPTLGIPATFDLVRECRLVNAFTDLGLSPETLRQIGERIINLERMFSLQFYRESAPFDRLPDTFLDTPLKEGPAKGSRVPLADMLAEYYQEMGWDASGRPTPEKLFELGLTQWEPGKGRLLDR